MTEDFSGRAGDALLGYPDAEDPAPEVAFDTPPTESQRLRMAAARSPEAELLDETPPQPKLWDAIERQLRDEGVIRD